MLIRSSGNRAFRLFFFDDLKILVNGESVQDVIEADDEAGYVDRYIRDATGRLALVEGGLRFKTERVEGTVVFSGTRRFSPDDAKAAAAAKRARRQARNNTIANRNAVRAAPAEGGGYDRPTEKNGRARSRRLHSENAKGHARQDRSDGKG